MQTNIPISKQKQRTNKKNLSVWQLYLFFANLLFSNELITLSKKKEDWKCFDED